MELTFPPRGAHIRSFAVPLVAVAVAGTGVRFVVPEHHSQVAAILVILLAAALVGVSAIAGLAWDRRRARAINAGGHPRGNA
jgi:hypothetical protein